MLIYRIILFVIAPFVAIRMLLALLRGRETRAGLGERMGRGVRATGSGPTIWVHGASLGELTSARALIDQILARNPGCRVIVTANTYTGRDMVAGWENPRIDARLAPLDSPRIVRRFLSRWSPVAALTLENELWPTRIIACQHAGIPVLVVAGRMSKGSARTWARFGGLARRVMGAISHLAPLDTANGDRFAGLGLPAGRISAPLNLKSDVHLAAPDAGTLENLRQVFKRPCTILAASTHPGEEGIILQAFMATQAKHPDLRLIMAPRHPNRSGAIAALIKDAGLSYSRRSDGGDPNPDNLVYLADTIGEMPLWYSLSSITVLGGSFAQKGGHTPFEPVQFSCLVVHGPDVSNHTPAYTALTAANTTFCAQTPEQLGQVLQGLINHPDQDELAHAAQRALAPLRAKNGEIDALLARLDELTGAKAATPQGG